MYGAQDAVSGTEWRAQPKIPEKKSLPEKSTNTNSFLCPLHTRFLKSCSTSVFGYIILLHIVIVIVVCYTCCFIILLHMLLIYHIVTYVAVLSYCYMCCFAKLLHKLLFYHIFTHVAVLSYCYRCCFIILLHMLLFWLEIMWCVTNNVLCDLLSVRVRVREG